MTRALLLVQLLSLAVAAAQSPDQLDLPPVQFSPQLEVIFADQGGVLRYEYRVTNPPTSSFHVEDVTVIPVRPLMPVQEWGEINYYHSLVVDQDRVVLTASFPSHCSGHGPSQSERRGYDYRCFLLAGPLAHNIGTTFSALTLASSVNPPAVVRVLVQGDFFPFQKAWQEQWDAYEAPDEVVEYFHRAAWSLHYTLGPMGHVLRSWSHWEYWLESLAKAAELGWFPDAALHAAISQRAHEARQAAAAGNTTAMRQHLDEAEALAAGASASQLHPFGRALVVYNARALRPAAPPRCESVLELDPRMHTFAVGEAGEVIARALIRGVRGPLVGERLEFRVLEGWQHGLTLSGVTDARGEVRFTVPAPSSPTSLRYRVVGGTRPVSPESTCGLGYVVQSGELAWAWPDRWVDLVISELIPPFVLSGPGRQIMIHETTANSGNLPVEVPTVTRYYASRLDTFDPAQAVVLGQRQVPALAPGAISDADDQLFTLPASLPVGQIWLFACADADREVAEYREDNNCSRGQAWLAAGAVPALAIAGQLPVGVVNTPYEGRLSASGGWAPYRFSRVGGELPPGLALAETGAIAGTPTQAGEYRFAVETRDELGLDGRGEFAITVTAAHGGAIPVTGKVGMWTLIGLLALAAAVGLWRGLRG